MKKFYITTAIDYVNAKPHIGHAYEKIAADILSRYHKIQNENVYFLTGVDEHGVKVEKAALAANLSPQEFCDNLAKSFQEAWNKLDIKYDKFIRTTSLEHKASVQNIFLKLKSHLNSLQSQLCFLENYTLIFALYYGYEFLPF